MNKLTHLNDAGQAHMVDVGPKDESERIAVAEGRIIMRAETLALIRAGNAPKGDVLAAARIAGIMAAKKTAELIPLCHPLPLTAVDVDLTLTDNPPQVHCTARVATRARTGVEMEALVAVEIALLTIYDMCKSMDRNMTLTDIRLLSKQGGRSGQWTRDA
jgi:cyclic pyranopterin monophosphate synthase